MGCSGDLVSFSFELGINRQIFAWFWNCHPAQDHTGAEEIDEAVTIPMFLLPLERDLDFNETR